MYEETVIKKRSWKTIIFKIVVIILVLLIAFFLFRSLINKDGKNTNTGNTFATNFQNLKKVAEKYYTDEKLPANVGDTNKVTLKELISEKYIDNLKDSKGNSCSPTNSFAEMKKTASNKYSLKVQLTCDDEQNYIISTITKEENEIDDIDVDVVEKPTEEVTETPTENIETTNTTENTTPVENKESVSTTPAPSTKTTTKSSTTKKKTTTSSSSTKTNTTTNNNTNTNNNTSTNNQTTTTTPKAEVKATVYYSVTFDPKGSKNIPVSQNVIKGGYAINPGAPVRNGYTFLGWYYNEQLFDFNTPINQSYALYAKWKAN